MSCRGDSGKSSSASSFKDSTAEAVPARNCWGATAPLTPQISKISTNYAVVQQTASVGTTGTTDPDYEVDWAENDKMNPQNWPIWYKGLTIWFVSWGTWTVALYSSSYTTGIFQMMADFKISSEPVVTLGISTFLIGVAAGGVILAPISEMYGRRPVYIVSMLLFMLLVIPAGIGSSLAEVLVVRFFSGLTGACLMANSPGTVSDIVSEEYLALAFSLWSIGPMNGPTFGPVVGGFVTQCLGWRWTNWVVMIFSGATWICMLLLKETYSPALLRQKAALRRKETNDPRWWSRYDNKISLFELLKVNLSRPFVMFFTEPICMFWDVYIAIIYAILYLCFVAYPIIFYSIRGWSIGISSLAFVGIGVGVLITIALEPLIRRMFNAHKHDPETGKPPPEAMVSVVCIAAVIIPIGQLWFAWTCVPPVHWIWPILAGVPFGMGNTAVFIYATNYLAQSYGIYASSALAGNALLRSFTGATLPLAGPAMYAKLGPHWAGTLLGLVQIAIIPIPVVFYKYGGAIREKSTLIKSMQNERKRLEGRASRVGGHLEVDAASVEKGDVERAEKLVTRADVGEGECRERT